MRTHLSSHAKVDLLESRILFASGWDDACRSCIGEDSQPAPLPPQPFIIPIGGVPQVDWAITAYTDQDPLPGVARDYRGRGNTFDGSTDVNFALADFAAMDGGVDVYAAAAGTAVEVHDGEYDRYTSFIDPPPPGTPDNYVLIDHGDGWQTRYGRLRNGSVA